MHSSGCTSGSRYYWDRRNDDALAAWRSAASDQPDTAYAVRAGDFLHPQYAPGLPPFLPSFQPPLRIRALPGPQQLAALRAGAAHGGAHAKLLYGTVLQRLGRPVSAEREFTAAARLAPNDPDARVAEAVGRFDKAKPARAFGRLGPLTRVFPHAQTVRFHLGLLLLWSAQVKEARKQLQQAQREAPRLAARQAGDAVPGGARSNWDRLTEIRAVRPMALRPVAVEDCRIRSAACGMSQGQEGSRE